MSGPVIRSFSTLWRNKRSRASSSFVPGGAATSFSRVMISDTGVSSLVWKRQSRRVRMPTTRFFSSTIGSPEMLWRAMMSRASRIVALGCSVTGSRMTPLAERLTLSTSAAWRSIDKLRWITPIPPSRARATASFSSVTVSMAAEASGTWISTFFEKRVVVRTSRGMTSA